MAGFRRNVFLGALTLLLTAASASAQLSTAELSGRVTDTSGAVLPGVTVTMTQTNTQATRTAVTDADGTYVISNLPTGPYRLEVGLYLPPDGARVGLSGGGDRVLFGQVEVGG